MRRVAAALLAAVALAAMTGRAGADEEVPMAQAWGGSNVQTPAPITAPITQLHIDGRIQRGMGRPDSVAYTRPAVAITMAAPDDPVEDAGCDTDGPATAAVVGNPTFGGTVTTGWKRYAYSADIPFAPTHNGTAKIYVCFDGHYDGLDTQVLVRLPAPTVTNLNATADGHQVDLTWDDMRGAAPDLAGYRIERSVGGGTFTALQTTGPEATSFTDTTLPAEGGKASYRVVALRPFVADAAPSNTSDATFAAAPGDPGAGGTGGTGTGGDRHRRHGRWRYRRHQAGRVRRHRWGHRQWLRDPRAAGGKPVPQLLPGAAGTARHRYRVQRRSAVRPVRTGR